MSNAHFSPARFERGDSGGRRMVIGDHCMDLRNIEDFAQRALTELRVIHQEDEFDALLGDDLFDAKRRHERFVRAFRGDEPLR